MLDTEYKLRNEVLIKVNSPRDLGVFLDTKLNLDYHTQIITSKVYRMYRIVYL